MTFFKQLLFSLFLLMPLAKIYADEDNSRFNSIQLKVSLKQDLTKNKQIVKKMKIDKNTEAKITISSEKPDIKEVDILKNDIDKLNDRIKKNDQEQQNSAEELKRESIIEQSKYKNAEEIKKNVQEDTCKNSTKQDIIINGNEKSTLTIKDGVKNININFQPNIVSKNKQQAPIKKNSKNRKVTTKKISKRSKKKTIKTSDNVKKTVNTNAKQTYDYNDLVSKNNSESTEGNIIIIDKIKEKEDENRIEKKDVNNENKPQNQKTTDNNKNEKQDIYIINRIINVDEDMPLTEETLKQLNAKQANEEDINVKVIQENDGIEKIKTNNSENTNNKQLSAYKYDKSENKFKQRYDLMTANHISYGEVAFVKDYNN